MRTLTKKKLLLFLILSVLAAVLSIFFLDHQAMLYFENPEFKLHYWQFFRTWTDIGLGEHYFLVALVVYVLSKYILPKIKGFQSQLSRIDFYRRWSVNLFASLLTSGITLQLIKHLVGRQRPIETKDFDPFVFQPFNMHHYFHSMPSGHSQVIFAAATLFSFLLPKLKWFWFSVAVFIAFSRVATQQHWVSDTMIGAYIGWSVSTLTILWLAKKKNYSLL